MLRQFTCMALIVPYHDGLYVVRIGDDIVTRPGEELGMTWQECRELLDEIAERFQEKMAALN